MRNVAKLFLNSLYGMFGLNMDDTHIVYLSPDMNESEYNSMRSHGINLAPGKISIADPSEVKILKTLSKRWRDGVYTQLSDTRRGELKTNVGIAGIITSLSRILLVKGIITCGLSNVIYCDTDSIITKSKPNLITGSNLGD